MNKGNANALKRWTVVFSLTAGFFAALGGCSSVNTGNSATALTLRTGTPSAGSAFQSLYVVEGTPATTSYTQAKPSLGSTPPASTLKDGDQISLRLFHFNDMHSKLVVPHAKKGDTRNFAQMVKIVRAARQSAAAHESVLFFSAGDDHTGEVYDELLGSDTSSFVMSMPYRAYSAAGLDFATLGNHEFDKGSAILAKMIEADARFPVLSANVSGSTVLGTRHVNPAIIGVTQGVRIAVVGLTSSEETKTGFAEDPHLAFKGVLTTLSNLMPALKDQADIFIVLSHIGFNGADAAGTRHVIAQGDMEIARYLATLGKPAMVVGGHTHSILNANGLEPANVIDGVPIFQAGSWGSHLGEIGLTLAKAGGKINMHVTSAKLNPLKKRDIRVAASDPLYAALEQDSDVDLGFQQTVMDPMISRLGDRLAVVLGVTSGQADIGRDATIADRYVGESAIANFMNDAIASRSSTFAGGAVDLVAFNASAIVTGVPVASQLTFADWYAVMPYADIIRVVEMNGQQIKNMVESNAHRLVRPGETVNLNGFVSRGFLHFSSALRYQINLGASPQSAVASHIQIKGKPIESVLNQTYRVAFGDYIANGNEGWKGAPILAGLPGTLLGFDLKSLPNKDTGLVYRNEIIEYIKTHGGVGATSAAAKDGRVSVKP
jgi:2',3'-cyclic-nucleotide 2'-phosphodiesterase (5'-nucleotidase family)